MNFNSIICSIGKFKSARFNFSKTHEIKSFTLSTSRTLTVNIIVVGRKNGAEDWIDAGCFEYEKRLTGSLNVKTTFVKTDLDLQKAAESAKGLVLALDETGKEMASSEFSVFLYKSLEKGGARVSFLVGGFAGLPVEIKKKYPLISISKMTWTHQMIRLLLTEQLYRACEIHKGSSYHKE